MRSEVVNWPVVSRKLLKTGEWDGGIGWAWGGKDRCDAMDPQCGPNGQLRDGPMLGQAVPSVMDSISCSCIAAIEIEVGRG